MSNDLQQLEIGLHSENDEARVDALFELEALLSSGAINRPEPSSAHNLHSHTIYSYNGYGYTPSEFAWKALMRGLCAGGIVDFDVLDGANEFLAACTILGIRGTVGLETRVFVPALADQVINSPGEPGIAYHMGVGFTSAYVNDYDVLQDFKHRAQQRNQDIVERVNEFLAPLTIDYEKDVLSLTPRSNATERHICEAYQRAGAERTPDKDELALFWSTKLSEEAGAILALLESPVDLQSLIRAKTMKRGGVGYVQPDSDAFPKIETVNEFVAKEGAIPTCAWLDGTTDGESDPERLLDLHQEAGTLALNIIPERNWNIKDAETKRTKLHCLERIIAAATDRSFPIAVGTEMNAAGLPFVDNFDAPELQPFVSIFHEGAMIFSGHTRMQSAAGMGYTSAWAEKELPTQQERNGFYKQVGEKIVTNRDANGLGIDSEMSLAVVREAIENSTS